MNTDMKKEVEEMLGIEVRDESFTRALTYAVRKQLRAYRRENRKEILERSYLVRLTSEQVKLNALSDYTMAMFGNRYEKSTGSKTTALLKATHILTVSEP